MAGVGTYPNELSGISKTSTIKVIPPPGQIYGFAPPQVIFVVLFLTDFVSLMGFFVTPDRNEPPAPPTNITVQRAGSQFSSINLTLGFRFLGIDKNLAYLNAKNYFETLLEELVLDLTLLKKEVVLNRKFNNRISQSMQDAAERFIPSYITPMAAVAGSIADNILKVLIDNTHLEKAYVNNGGDISFYLNENQTMKGSLAAIPNMITEIKHKNSSRGIATSGWRGKSFSRGIADSVTVLAKNAAIADAAATMIGNAVDIYDHPNIKKKPANFIYDDSD